jgi:predicted histone-like DNA-binding protein
MEIEIHTVNFNTHHVVLTLFNAPDLFVPTFMSNFAPAKRKIRSPMLKYYKLEQRDSFDMHKTRTVYRLLAGGHVTEEQFIKMVAHRRGFSESVIAGVLTDVAEELALLLGGGDSVSLPGIGSFSLGVRLKKGRKQQLDEEQEELEGTRREATEPNARNIELHHLNFRKDKELFRKIQVRFDQQTLKRVGGKEGRRITIDDTTQQQRIAAAHQYLQEHHFMHVSDYAALTGLSYSSAQRELRELDRYQFSGITSEGRGSHRVYVLRKGGEN